MADTTADVARVYESGVEPMFNHHELNTGLTIHEGAAVVLSNSTNKAVTFTTTNSTFAGFSMAKAVQGTDTHVQVRARGIIKLTVGDDAGTPDITGLDVGDQVYASDHGSFTMTAGTNKSIGKVARIEPVDATAETAVCMVYFEAASLASV